LHFTRTSINSEAYFMTFPSQPVEGRAHNNDDAAAAHASVTACPNCHAEMPGQMRFCRLCGYRLGEGVAEYAETVRFQGPPTGAPRPVQTAGWQQSASAANGQPAATPGSFRDLNRMAHQAGQPVVNQGRGGVGQSRKICRRHSWPHWFIWPIIGLTMSVAAAGNRATRSFWHQVPVIRINTHAPQPPSLPPLPVVEEESVLGTNHLKDADGGASFEYVTPGSAADQAGLVGGDIINSFDGHPVKDSDQLEELLAHTPQGKTVQVVFTRDGKAETTNLKTISEEENDLLGEQSKERSEGLGYIGEGTDLDRVRVPGMNIEGVRLGEIRTNNPAYIAGLRDGDIVIEFDNVPIRTRKEFESRIQRALPGGTALAVVVRNGQRLEIPVKIGKDD
jgi:hypothetical protein